MSKVTVEAKAFQAAMARVVGSVERHKSYPILQCVRIAVEEGEMEITSTNLDAAITVTLPATGICPPICTDRDRLLTIAGTLKDRGEMSFDVGADAAVIACGRSRFSVGLMPSDMWPSLKEESWETTFTLDGKAFARLMSALTPAICTEAARYYLNGIYLRPGSVADDRTTDSLLGVATDGHKLYARNIQVPDLPTGMTGIILPRGACATIAKSFGEAETLTVHCNTRKLQVEVEGATYLTKLVEGTFPDWRRVTPKTESALSYDRATLVAAARIAAAAKVSGKKGKAVKLLFGEEETIIEATDTDNPQFSGSDVARHSLLREPLAGFVGVNVDYLLEIVGELDAETIEIAPPSHGEGPILLRGATLGDRIAVIMSMRV